MKKLDKFTKEKVKDLLVVEKLAKKELAGAYKRYREEHARLLQNQILGSTKASRKAHRELSKKIAGFQFKHSKKINAALLSSPKFFPRFIGQHLSGEPGNPSGGGPGDPFGGGPGDPFGDWRGNPKDNPRWDEFVTTVIILERYFGIQDTPFDRFAFVRPHIYSCPTPICVDETYTITGVQFGASPGTIYITITDTGMRIDPVVYRWSDTAIEFRIPASVSGVPFHAEGTLTVINIGGYVGTVHVLVEPLSLIRSADDAFSDSGQDWPWNDYQKEIVLTSPVLPQMYELLSNSYLTTTGLTLSIETKTYLPEVEGPASVTLLEGPYQSGNRLQVKVKVTDDYYWDYEVTARFWITVPQGYSTQGWGGS